MGGTHDKMQGVKSQKGLIIVFNIFCLYVCLFVLGVVFHTMVNNFRSNLYLLLKGN